MGDGSIISITSDSNLAQHFPVHTDNLTKENKFGFQLSSDSVENNTYPIGDIYSDLNNGVDSQEGIHGYNKNQMLFHSGRITLNSKLDDIFVSSVKDIYIGSGRHLSINAFNSINVLSNNVNIGNPNKTTMESMVLGDTLKEVLTEMLSLFTKIKIVTSTGPMGIQSDPAFAAVVQPVIDSVTSKIEEITSIKHKIESNQ